MREDVEIPDDLVRILRLARNIAVLTGAGVSAESGVPTFRDAQTGLWAEFDPMQLATRDAFRRNPKLVWEWYAHRRELLAAAQPNVGHYALAQLEARTPEFALVTQNIDGLHQRAGSRHVVELHGNLSRNKCFREDTPVDDVRDDGEIPPRCPRCGAYIRPDVVWFGELLPTGALELAYVAVEACDVFFSIGTSGVVEPAASLPLLAVRRGAIVIEVNPDATPLSEHATFRLAGPSGAVLPRLVERVWGRRQR